MGWRCQLGFTLGNVTSVAGVWEKSQYLVQGFEVPFSSPSLKPLLSSPCVLVELSTDVITLGILNPKVAKREM